MNKHFQKPLVLPELSSWYLKVGVMYCLEAELSASGVKDIERYLITLDESSAILQPAEDVPNFPIMLGRIYTQRVPSVHNGDLTFGQLGMTAETAGTFKGEYLDGYSLRDVDTGFGDKLTLMNHYLFISEFGQISVLPCQGNWKDGVEALLDDVPADVLPPLYREKVKRIYEGGCFREELNSEELEAMRGVGIGYHNWLYMNAVLAAVLTSKRQADAAAAATAEEQRQQALLSQPEAIALQERMDEALAAGDTEAANDIIEEAQAIAVRRDAQLEQFAKDVTPQGIVRPEEAGVVVPELVDVNNIAPEQGSLAGVVESVSDDEILANIGRLQSEAERLGTAPQAPSAAAVEEALGEHERSMAELGNRVAEEGQHQ